MGLAVSWLPAPKLTPEPVPSRYQSLRQGSYPLPNDDIEQEREEMKHQMIKRLLDGRDFLAPIGERPQKILDIGTGVGLWAIDGKRPSLSPSPFFSLPSFSSRRPSPKSSCALADMSQWPTTIPALR